MNSEINETINDFNNTLLSLAINIAKVCPLSIIGTNINTIEKTLKNSKFKIKFIELFCIKVLKYKDQIDKGDESFFMDKDYHNDIDDDNASLLNTVISLKSIWKDLKRENKNIVIMNMQILCELSQQYYTYIIKQKQNTN